MFNLKKYKTLAFVSILAELVILFFAFGRIQNLILNNGVSETGKSVYLFIAIAAVIAVILFILSLININKDSSEEKYKNNKLSFSETGSTQKQSIEGKEKEDLLDAESYLKKILPKENSKLDLTKYTEKILSNIAKEFDIVQGLFFVKDKESDIFNISGSSSPKYAYFGDEEPESFKMDETLSGQVAKNQTILNLKEIPEKYITILSGLGSSSPNQLIIIPIIYEGKSIAIIELASFKVFKQNFIDLFEVISNEIGKVLSKY